MRIERSKSVSVANTGSPALRVAHPALDEPVGPNSLKNAKSSRKSRGRALLIAPVALIAGTLFSAPANAAAFPYGVYAPNKLNSYQVQGWANLSRDCSGTYGCYNYIKIERSNWWGASYQGGWWANANGWNSITADMTPGCFDYRTTVDSYNDVAGPYGVGANIGPVGATANGTKIYRYKSTWSSGWKTNCR